VRRGLEHEPGRAISEIGGPIIGRGPSSKVSVLLLRNNNSPSHPLPLFLSLSSFLEHVSKKSRNFLKTVVKCYYHLVRKCFGLHTHLTNVVTRTLWSSDLKESWTSYPYNIGYAWPNVCKVCPVSRSQDAAVKNIPWSFDIREAGLCIEVGRPLALLHGISFVNCDSTLDRSTGKVGKKPIQSSPPCVSSRSCVCNNPVICSRI
jgi:hypothetical protein